MKIEEYSFFLKCTIPVICNGFIAWVDMLGRVLLSKEEEDEWYAYGITPGGFCSVADSKEKALTGFLERLQSVLYDSADVVKSFREFSEEAMETFATNDEYKKMWDEADQPSDLLCVSLMDKDVTVYCRVEEIAETRGLAPSSDMNLAMEYMGAR
jgi:hypothetical protein